MCRSRWHARQKWWFLWFRGNDYHPGCPPGPWRENRAKQHAQWFRLRASSDTRQTVSDIRFWCRMFVTMSFVVCVRRDLRVLSLINIIRCVYSPGRTVRSSFSRPPASSVPIVHRRISSLSLSPSISRKKLFDVINDILKMLENIYSYQKIMFEKLLCGDSKKL